MNGPDFVRPSPEHIAVLERASSASITSMLRRRDVHRIGIPLKPIVPGLNRVVGPALTLRSVPGREDIRPLADQPETLYPGHPDDAIEALQPGDVLVHDGLGLTDEGLFGDLLVYRIKVRGAAGLVSWMCIRDLPHMAERGCRSSAWAASARAARSTMSTTTCRSTAPARWWSPATSWWATRTAWR